MSITQSWLDSSLEQIYKAAVEELSGVMDARNLYVALYDDRSRMIHFPLAYENGKLIPESEKAVGRPYSPRRLGDREGLTEWVIQHKEPLIVERDFEEWAERQAAQIFLMGTKCWLGAPIEFRGEVIGVIALQNFEEEGKFDEGHRKLLETIASQVAIAITNVRLFERVTTAQFARQRRLDLLALISQRMAEAAVDPHSVLELVVKAAQEVTDSDLTSLYEYDERTCTFRSGVRLNRHDMVVQHLAVYELPDADGVVDQVAGNQQEVFEENAASRFAQQHEIRAYAGLPLTVSAMEGVPTTVGVLFVNFQNPHYFSEDEKEILHHLATQAAIAISYAEARSSAFANEQLAALGQAAATLQHRLGNTINITLPAVMRLRYRIGNDPEVEEILKAIERNTLFANEVIRRMQMPLRPEPFKLSSVNSLLREAILKVTSETDRYPNVRLVSNLQDESPVGLDDLIQLPQIRVQANLEVGLPETYIGVARMSEVFRVLVENAIKAIYPNSGEVVVASSLWSGGQRRVVEIVVTDNGKGIEDSVRTRLFQQPVPRKEFGQGAGLGLWLSRIIVRSHRGDIDIRWTDPGKGSCFYVRLPILTRPPVQVSESGGLS
jgi:GAF domain-containing protein